MCVGPLYCTLHVYCYKTIDFVAFHIFKKEVVFGLKNYFSVAFQK